MRNKNGGIMEYRQNISSEGRTRGGKALAERNVGVWRKSGVKKRADPKEEDITSHRGAYYHKPNFYNQWRE